MKNIKYANLVGEMAKNGETLVTIGKLLGISDASVSRRLSGQTDWKISEIETLCEKFDKSYCELFEIKEKENKEND